MHKIMIIDDELIAQDMIRQYIEEKLPEYKVIHICNHGQEALAAFEKEPADILLVDIRMPIMDGLTFLEHLNKMTRDYTAIIISSYNEFEYAKTAIKLGVCHYLLKPLDYKELAEALNAAALSLNHKRIASAFSKSSSDDIQELYFQNIVLGKYSEQQKALEDFSTLGLPFSYDSKGIYIQIEFQNTVDWTYGQDAFITAAGNLLMLLYKPDFFIPVMHTQNSCNYILFCANPPKTLDLLCMQMKTLLHITVSAKELLSFSSIEQLRISSISDNPLSSDVSDIEDLTEISEIILRQRIDNAISYMKEHYGEDLSRDTVAAAVYVSPAYFSRNFKLITGISYKDYLTEIRMQKAMELLSTPMKISDISAMVGYQNPNRFNINFRQYTSYTPSEYRIHVLKML